MKKTRTIVVVEDDPIIVRSLQRVLRVLGVETIAFSTCEQARSFEGVAHTAIVDLELPDGDGIGLFADLHSSGRIHEAVFFSASTTETSIARARQAGIFVPKRAGVCAAVNAALHPEGESNAVGTYTRADSARTDTDEGQKLCSLS